MEFIKEQDEKYMNNKETVCSREKIKTVVYSKA
jgi:hypothetical protein